MSAPLQGFVEIGQTDLFSTKASASSDYSDYIPIFDANDLKAISENLDAKYILIKDIDLSSENWTPIGTESAPFTGIFDGNGNTISNLSISGTYANGAQLGLFGYANGAEFTNVKLKNVQINILGTTASNAYLSIGPICGVIKNTIIDKCDADGNIVCLAEKGNYVRVAGIVGESYSSSSITNCLSSCSLVGNAKSQNCMVGGIAAWLGASSVAKCLFAGSINAGTSSTYVYCGGIGASGDCGISESVVLASELNNNGISSAYGTSLNGYICWRNTSNNRVLTGISGNVTGLRGSGNSMITEEQAVNQNTYTDMDWDFNDIWFMDNGYPSLRHNATCENVDAWEDETSKIENKTIYGKCEIAGLVVGEAEPYVDKIKVDGNTYYINKMVSLKKDILNNQSKYENKKVLIVVKNGEIVWLETFSDIKSSVQISLDPSIGAISYENKLFGNDYSAEYIDLKVRVSNAMLSNFPGDENVLSEISELSVLLTTAKLNTNYEEILNFDGNNFKNIDMSPVSIPLGKSVLLDDTLRIDVNKNYKMSDIVQMQVEISCLITFYKNGELKNGVGYLPITVSNLSHKKPTSTSSSGNTGNSETSAKETEELAKKLRSFINNSTITWGDFSVLDDFDITKCFNANELKAIEAELFYCIVSIKSIEKSWDQKLMDKLLLDGLNSDFFKVSSNSVIITKTKYIEPYGNAKIKFTCDFSELTAGCYKGDIYYEIYGQKANRPKERAAFFVNADTKKFYNAMKDFTNDINPGWSAAGDTVSDAVDIIFEDTLRDVLLEAGFDSLLDMSMQGISFMKKQVVAYCPVNVYVYNNDNELVACIENNEVVLSTENAKASVEGDTKIIWLYDDIYRVEYQSLAEFDMKVVVEEYGNDYSHLRTTTIDNIPLNVGTNFAQTIDESILEDTDYSLISTDGTTYSPTSDVVKLHEHIVDEKMELIRDATCSEYGFYCGLCSVCQEWCKIIIDETSHTESDWIIDTKETCAEEGEKYIECTECKETVLTEKIPATGHNDNNHDGICDSCSEDFTKGCSCNCHSNAFMQFIHKILCFLYRIFGMEQYRYCGCGKAH